MCFNIGLTLVFDHVIVETISFSNLTMSGAHLLTTFNNLSYWGWNVLYKTLTVWRKPFNGGDMKHPINGKVRLYYVCNNIEFKKVLVLLRILKHLSSWARSVMTHLLMRDSYALIETKKTRFVLVCPSIASYLGQNFQQLVVIW